jgi:RNA polymerase sigma factor (sigma-70 family)
MSFRRTDSSRFAELVRPHFDALFAAARRLTVSAADAEDLVQDVCLKAHLHIDELETIEFRRAWLLKILYHRFIDIQRTRDRSPVDMADTGADSHDPELISPDGARPEDLVEREMRVDKIVTGLPEGTLKSRLHRTRARLGRLLSNEAMQKPVLTVVGSKK